MPTYLILGKYTDQGIKTVMETAKRRELFKQTAEQCGVRVKQIMWLLGEYDVMDLVEADDDKSITALLLKAGSWGFVRTTTCRAFSQDEMASIFQKIE